MRTPSLLLLALLAGCVGKGRHELVEVQLEATRAALDARVTACQEEIRDLEARRTELTDAASDARLRAEELAERLAGLEAELEDLRAEKARWLRDRAEADALASKEAEPTAKTAKTAKKAEVAGDGGADAEPPPLAPAEEIATALSVAAESRRLAARVGRHHAGVAAAFAPLVEAGRAEVARVGDDVVVRIGVHSLFQEGRVLLSPLGETVIADAAEALATLPGRTLKVEGHTDDRPHHSVQFASNWELGFGRAITVLRALEGHDLPMRPTAGSKADTSPLLPPGTEGASRRNARVELVLTLQPVPAPAPAEDPPDDEDAAPQDG